MPKKILFRSKPISPENPIWGATNFDMEFNVMSKAESIKIMGFDKTNDAGSHLDSSEESHQKMDGDNTAMPEYHSGFMVILPNTDGENFYVTKYEERDKALKREFWNIKSLIEVVNKSEGETGLTIEIVNGNQLEFYSNLAGTTLLQDILSDTCEGDEIYGSAVYDGDNGLLRLLGYRVMEEDSHEYSDEEMKDESDFDDNEDGDNLPSEPLPFVPFNFNPQPPHHDSVSGATGVEYDANAF